MNTENGTFAAKKFLKDILAYLSEFYEISKTQQKILTEKKTASSKELPDEHVEFSILMEKRDILLIQIQENVNSLNLLLEANPQLAGDEVVRAGREQVMGIMEHIAQSDHYVTEMLAFLQENTVAGFLKNIQLIEGLKGYKQAKKANDLVTRIFGDNPRRFDHKR